MASENVPDADYFRPLKKQATCNCGAKPGRPVAECAECTHAKPAEEPQRDSPEHRRLSELQAENDRLTKLFRDIVQHVDDDVCVLASANQDLMPRIREAAGMTPAQPEFPGSPPDESGDWKYSQTCGHWVRTATPAETGEAEKLWEARRVQSGDLEHSSVGIFADWYWIASGEQATAAADWLNRRAEIEAQLATYKQLCREIVEYLDDDFQELHSSETQLMPRIRALAAQLESQQPSDGK